MCEHALGDEFDWSALVRLIHPLPGTIIEAMCWVDEPLSPNLINQLTGKKYGVSTVAYHVRVLADRQIIVKVAERRVRGTTERLYRLHPGLVA